MRPLSYPCLELQATLLTHPAICRHLERPSHTTSPGEPLFQGRFLPSHLLHMLQLPNLDQRIGAAIRLTSCLPAMTPSQGRYRRLEIPPRLLFMDTLKSHRRYTEAPRWILGIRSALRGASHLSVYSLPKVLFLGRGLARTTTAIPQIVRRISKVGRRHLIPLLPERQSALRAPGNILRNRTVL
jgi:hypothetical protein